MYQPKLVGRLAILFTLVAILLLGACSSTDALAPASDMAAADEAVAESVAGGEEFSANTGSQRKIVGRAHIDLIVTDPAKAVDQIKQLASRLGGYVSNTDLYRRSVNDESLLQGSMTLRVPADQLDRTLGELEALALSVEAMDLNREDVTDQYSDVEAQLRNLEAAETELRELLSEVRTRPNAKPEDILEIHREIVGLRSEIEQLAGRQKMLDNLIALSTINVQLRPDTSNSQIFYEGWQPGLVVNRALNALVNALQIVGNLLIWFVLYALPLLALLAIPVYLIYWFLRRRRRRQ